MSADFDFNMTTPALLKAAELYHACSTFHVERDASRHYCSNCGASAVAHIIVALRTALHANQTPCDAFVHELERLNYREDKS